MIDRKAVREWERMRYGLIGKEIEEKHEREVNEFLAFMLKEKLSRDFTLSGEPLRHGILKAWVLDIVLPNSVEVMVFCCFNGNVEAIACRRNKEFFHPAISRRPERTELDEQELYNFISACSRIVIR